MTATTFALPIRSPIARRSRVARLLESLKRRRTDVRARRALARLDSRTLRDIGLTQQDAIFFSCADGRR